ncbi:unnamed protein product [Eruca vesicaria subsp. sativa]|uniref:Flavoprotein pyridine nucleotide cytochrome reductase-like FAD-binding domain-containing protein n=1 Tax=Eruca vesicaria subsp. sativa TaxID=29727 RepID=A0ABC8LGY8_ERUVS|nr:unnamed protein product [Eruca vesicaria subsp. sativa]
MRRGWIGNISSTGTFMPPFEPPNGRGNDAQGEEVIKPYTPTTIYSDLGRFELVVKMYPQGRMSHHSREVRRISGNSSWQGGFKYQTGQFRSFGMLAVVQASLPCFKYVSYIARAILENPTDKIKVHLIYANVTYDDILLKPPEVWDGGVGFVTKEMIQAHCPAPASDIQILRC